MAHKGKTTVATSKLVTLAEEKGAQVESTTGYLIITKKGEPNRQVLVERSIPKGKLESSSRWIELRGKGKVPYLSSSPGVVPHDHSSPSIKARLDMDVEEAKILETFGLLMNDLLGIKEEVKEEEQVIQAA
jgi:hypothetical protein